MIFLIRILFLLVLTKGAIQTCTTLPECDECNVTTECTRCQVTYSLQGSQCQLECNDGYYADSVIQVGYLENTLICVQCPLECAKCSANQICSDCADGYLLQDQNCQQTCNTSYFNHDKKCIQCDQDCITCKENSSNCQSCANNLLLQSSTCVQDCQDGYYQVNNICYLCNDCQTCKTTSSNCLSCRIDKYKFGNICYDVCPEQTYPVQDYCLYCESNCLLCSDDSTCTKCNTPFKINGQSCVSQCPDEMYEYDQVCIMCNDTCVTCTSSTICITCAINLNLRVDGSCQSKCEDGYYADDVLVCKLCPLSCMICSSINICKTCAKGFYLDSESTCQQCRISCAACQDSTNTNCSECIVGFYLNGTICEMDCPSNYFEDIPSKSCIQCGPTCLECNEVTNCNSCKSNLQFFNGQCLIKCPDGTYKDVNSMCSLCDISCSKCTGVGFSNCSQCTQYYYLSETSCVTSCPDKFYNDTSLNTCLACISPCLTCDSQNQCKTCLTGFFMLQGTCGASCSQGWQQTDMNICADCENNCFRCSQVSKCQICNIGYFLLNESCLQTCPDGTYSDLINFSCTNCQAGCLICTDQTTCLMCNSPVYYSNSQKCTLQCPLDKYIETVSYSCVSQCPQNFATLELTKQCYLVCPEIYYQSSDMRCLTIDQCPTNSIKNPVLRICTNELCSDGYFKDSRQKNLCTQSCSNNGYGDPTTQSCMTQCPAPYFGDSTTFTCVIKCPPPFYQNDQQINRQCASDCGQALYKSIYSHQCLKACPENLLTVEDKKECVLSCPNGYTGLNQFCTNSSCMDGYYKDENNICQPCNTLCTDCYGASFSQCTKCVLNVYLQISKCLSKCEKGFYNPQSEFTCIACEDINCQICSKKDYCQECSNGYWLQPNNKNNLTNSCLTACNDGYFKQKQKIDTEETLTCIKCNAVCKTCSGGLPNQCLSCNGASVYLDKGTCSQTCPSQGYYQDQTNFTCQKCNQICQACFGPSTNQCTQCIDPYLYYASKTICTINCPDDLYGDLQKNICITRCPAQTFGHPISKRCLDRCPDPLWGDLSTQTCQQVCPEGTYTDPNEKSCRLCDPNCSKCTGDLDDQCYFCGLGYFMDSNTCITNCDRSQYENQTIRKCTEYLAYTITILQNSNILAQVTFKIDFNNIIDPGTLDFDSQVTIDGLTPITDYTLSYNELEQFVSYTVQVKFFVSHTDTQLLLNFGGQLKDIQGTPLSDQGVYSLPINAQFQLTDQVESLVEINKIMTYTYLSILITIFGISKLLKTQIRIFYSVIFHLQSINILLLLNFHLPVAIQEALVLLDVVNLKSIPVIGQKVASVQDGCQYYYFGHRLQNQVSQNNVFLVANYTYSFLTNGGMQIYMYIVTLWIAWAISSLLHTLYQIKSKLSKIQIFRSLYELLNDLLMRVHELLFYPVCLEFFLQMWGANFDDQFNIASFCLAILVMLYYVYFLYSTFETINKDDDSKEHEDYVLQRYGQIFLDFTKEDKFKRNFLFFQYAVKLCYCGTIVLLNRFPWVQFALCCATQFFYLGVLYKKKPYKSKFFNQICIIGQILFLCLFAVLMTGELQYIKFADHPKISVEQLDQFYQVGLAFDVLVQVLLTTYTGLMILNKVQDYIKFINANPEWCSEFLIKLQSLSAKQVSQLEEKEGTNIQLREFRNLTNNEELENQKE